MFAHRPPAEPDYDGSIERREVAGIPHREWRSAEQRWQKVARGHDTLARLFPTPCLMPNANRLSSITIPLL